MLNVMVTSINCWALEESGRGSGGMLPNPREKKDVDTAGCTVPSIPKIIAFLAGLAQLGDFQAVSGHDCPRRSGSYAASPFFWKSYGNE